MPAPLREQVEAGACGLKVHEDWGSTPAVIDAALRVADEYDVQLAIHTDTLNEAGFVEDTIARDRRPHDPHLPHRGRRRRPRARHHPLAGEPNVLPSSTNPTRPYTVNTLAEHMDMLMVCHHLNPQRARRTSPSPTAASAPRRWRRRTCCTTSACISMYSSDSQAMGRIGESFTRLIQTAHKMKDVRGPLAGEHAGDDNQRVLRYLAKLTINPAITHGIAHEVGSLEPGKLADIVLWPVGFFGVKPAMIVKGGAIAWSVMGNAERLDPDGGADALPADVRRASRRSSSRRASRS